MSIFRKIIRFGLEVMDESLVVRSVVSSLVVSSVEEGVKAGGVSRRDDIMMGVESCRDDVMLSAVSGGSVRRHEGFEEGRSAGRVGQFSD